MIIPRYYIIKIQDSYLAELLYWWIQFDKPCKLLFQKPKYPQGVSGVRVTVKTDEAAEFILKAKSATGFKLLEEDENHNLLDNKGI